MTDETNGRARVRTVFLGSGAFAVPSLEAVAAHPEVRLVAVVTAPARPAGRRGLPAVTPVERAARDLDLDPILTPLRLREPASAAAILDLRPGLIVLADYGQIVPAPLLELEHGALNLHPSLLPRHRGATPIPAAILAGDAETGVTLMRMDVGLDTGPIVAQAQRRLDGTETTPRLESELAELAAELLAESLGPWLHGALAARPQAETDATMTRPLRREDGRLDATRAARELERRLRAYQPWPGSFVDTTVGRLVVWSADAESAEQTAEQTAEPGTFDARGLAVGGGSRLALREVQPAGGRRMSWAEYVRGRPGILGTRVVDTPR